MPVDLKLYILEAEMLILLLSALFAFCVGLLIQRWIDLHRTLKKARKELLVSAQELATKDSQLRELQTLHVRMQEETRAALAQTACIQNVEERFQQAFRALSAEALHSNNQAFLNLARLNLEQYQMQARSDLEKRQAAIDQLVKPVHDSLQKFELKLTDLERARGEGAAALREQLSSLVLLQHELHRETGKLSGALKATAVRGRWGEVQLRRVVELAGMVAHCDFYEQPTLDGGDTGRKRPDLVVKLPNNRSIVVDAKVPLDAYLQACETHDEHIRSSLMKRHADQVRVHIRTLASKGYSQHITSSPEFVVLFLPGEIFFSAALAEDPTLIEIGAELGVILATPTTLISLLRAVSYGWKQESISQHAQKISELGAELYKRLGTMTSHWAKLGKQLGGAIQAYNESIGSMEHRVLATAREFERLGVSTAHTPLPPLSPVDHLPRQLSPSVFRQEDPDQPPGL